MTTFIFTTTFHRLKLATQVAYWLGRLSCSLFTALRASACFTDVTLTDNTKITGKRSAFYQCGCPARLCAQTPGHLLTTSRIDRGGREHFIGDLLAQVRCAARAGSACMSPALAA